MVKGADYEADTARNRGIPWTKLNRLSNCVCFVSFLIVLLIIKKSFSKVILLETHYKTNWPLMHIQPESGKYLANFSNHHSKFTCDLVQHYIFHHFCIVIKKLLLQVNFIRVTNNGRPSSCFDLTRHSYS